MGYIGTHGVAALHRYKYSGVDHSFTAKYVLQPFWTRFVKLFPLWMPPNMITLIGFMFLVTSAILSYIYSPRLDLPPPRWVNFAHGLLLFLYQTFDAVDGKQARRTNSSSPLGELFDHGCDALACAFEALAVGSTTMSGRDAFWFWLISAIPFYCATWEHYFTNTLILPAINGPTEGLMLIYVAHFFTTLVGAEWWAQQFGKSLPFLSWVPIISDMPTYRVVQFLMVAFAVIPTVLFNVQNAYRVVKARKGNMLHALAMLFPFVVLVGGVLIWDYLSPHDPIATYPHLVIMGTGLAFGFLVGRMILAHLCDEPKGLKTSMCLDLIMKRTIGSGREEQGLYLLNDGEQMANHTVVLKNGAEDLELWHRSLGHPSFTLLKHMFPNSIANIDFSCFTYEACELGKHHRASFAPSYNKSSTPFALIHTDVWGPSRTVSLKGHRWFVYTHVLLGYIYDERKEGCFFYFPKFSQNGVYTIWYNYKSFTV